MNDRALVDRLRALGHEDARRVLDDVEAELGPAAVAALRYAPEFWLRPAQVVEPPYATIEIFIGERGTGKSHGARELFCKLLPTTERPRIVVGTDAAAFETVFDGESGLARWTSPGVRCQYRESKGYAGDILYGPHRIVCMSAAAPVGAIGTGYGLTWADDIAAWIEAVGEKAAANAWNHVLKSNRAKPGIIIVTTTGRAAEFLFRLMDTDENRRAFADTRVHDLGAVENNAGNLTKRFANIVKGLRSAGEWEEGGDPIGAFSAVNWPTLRVRSAPRMRRIAVAVDPAKTWHRKSCEVGVVAVGSTTAGESVVSPTEAGRWAPTTGPPLRTTSWMTCARPTMAPTSTSWWKTTRTGRTARPSSAPRSGGAGWSAASPGWPSPTWWR